MENIVRQTKNQRIYYLDILRVVACLCVILTHASSQFVVEEIGSFNFWIGNIVDGLSRIAVPLFVMISGVLMLDKNYHYTTKKLIKHIVKMIMFFVFWSAIYSIVLNIIEPVIIQHKPIDIKKIIGSFIEGHYHLWFIYMIVGLYLILPLLRLWVKEENKKYVEYFIILSIIFTYIIPQIISIGSNYSDIFENINDIIQERLNIKYVGGYTTYFLLGWYIHNYDLKNKKSIYALGVIGTIITIVGTYVLSVSTGKAVQMYDNLSFNILFQSIMIFMLIKTKFQHTNNKENKFITIVSKNSLGIYAIHAAFVPIIYNLLIKAGLQIAIINISLVFIISFIIALLGSYIISKIPIIKRIAI